MHCVAGAMAVGAAASGSRVWFIARAGSWLTPRRKRAVTAGLIGLSLVGAGLVGPSP